VAVDPARDRVFVAHLSDSGVTVMDGTTNTVVKTIAPLPDSAGLALDAEAGLLYLAHRDRDLVSVIDVRSYEVVQQVAVRGGPFHIWVSAISHRVYVSGDGNGTLSVLDGATRAILATVPLGDTATALAGDAAAATLYVPLSSGSLAVVADRTSSVRAPPAGLVIGGVLPPVPAPAPAAFAVTVQAVDATGRPAPLSQPALVR